VYKGGAQGGTTRAVPRAVPRQRSTSQTSLSGLLDLPDGLIVGLLATLCLPWDLGQYPISVVGSATSGCYSVGMVKWPYFTTFMVKSRGTLPV